MPVETFLLVDHFLDRQERIDGPLSYPSPSPSADPVVFVITQELLGQPSSGGWGGRWIYLPSSHHDTADAFCVLVFVFAVSTALAFLLCFGLCNPHIEHRQVEGASTVEEGKMCKV